MTTKEKDFFVYWLRRAYDALSREGWEEGPSSEETRTELMSVLDHLEHRIWCDELPFQPFPKFYLKDE